MKLKIFLLYDGEKHWIAAENEQKAKEVYLKEYGFEETVYEIEIKELDDNDKLSIKYEDEAIITKTCKEWCEEGERIVGATVW